MIFKTLVIFLNLHFANDRIVEALKWILIGFEDLSVPKINFNKSKIIPLNISKREVINLANRLGYKIANLPISYLGVPLHWKKIATYRFDRKKK